MQETCKKLDYKIGDRDLIPATWYGLEAIEILTNKNVFGDTGFDKDMSNIVYESVVLLQEYKIELDKKRMKDGK